MNLAYLTLIDERPLADILRFAAAHGDPMHTAAATAPTIPSMPAANAEPRPTMPASPKGKRAGTYSIVAPRAK